MMSSQTEKPEIAKALVKSIAEHCPERARVMEVCGSHTMSIARNGIRELLPDGLELLSGPGCPVCVTPTGAIDALISIALEHDAAIATFGDMMRVPGTDDSLQDARAKGARVEVVYSPLDALQMAKDDPAREVVFAGVGFETTAPLVAATIKRAAAENIPNFTVMCMHKNVPHVLEALVNDDDVAIDAFILPGHVSTIIGATPYGFLASRYHVPGAITGFEALDILKGIAMLVRQLESGEARIEIAYSRGVSADGNPTALALLDEVFEECESVWRGIGRIPLSGYGIRDEFADFDAMRRFDVEIVEASNPPGCRCADVLKGIIRPAMCPLFGRACTPQDPVGPCMVSSEGSCAAHYKYRLG